MAPHDDWRERQESATVTVEGHELEVAYYDEGDGPDPPVLFVHGIPTWSFLWRDVAPAFAGDRRVIAPDLAGYGESSMYDGFDRSIRAQEAVLGALLDELGVDSCVLVGHDIGGGVGVRLAVNDPGRIEALVLSNATVYDSWPIEFIVDLGLPSTIRTMSVEECRETLSEAYRDTLHGDPAEAFVEGMCSQWDTEEAVVSLGRNAIATNTNHTTEIAYGEIEAETLLLWGTEDDEQPIEDAERLAEDLPNATLAPVESAGHWVPEDRPTEYRERLAAFLDS